MHMLKKILSAVCCLAVIFALFSGCGAKSAAPALEDGIYEAKFNTDSTMFHVNETYDDKGILTVKDGKMTLHVTLASTSIQNLFIGTAEKAQKKGAQLIDHTVETVKYKDGTTDEANAFDIPVPYLDKEFDCAIIGKKGKWYDHKVSVTDVAPYVEKTSEVPADGEYTAEVTLTGGSGKAYVTSPAKIVIKDGKCTATVVWSSSHYERMTVGGENYEPVTLEGGSTFEIPVELDTDMQIMALTTAMSKPHDVEYTLRFDSATLK